MADHKSALKHHRQSEKARRRNRGHLSRMRTAVKRLRQALAAGDAATARALLSPTHAVIDRSARHGVIHANLAARTKSRLARAVAKVGA
jgi:small subunit ribosomal protein S20